MRVSNLFGETLRKPPADAGSASLKLLLRAGYIRQTDPGIFSFLPLGLRTLEKIGTQFSETLQSLGGQQVHLPSLRSCDADDPETGSGALLGYFAGYPETRWQVGGSSGELAPLLAASDIRSYRQLPRLLYFHSVNYSETAKASAGLLNARENPLTGMIIMARNQKEMQKKADDLCQAISRIAGSLDVPLPRADGFSPAPETICAVDFTYFHPHGEEIILNCDSCGYSATQTAAGCHKTDEKRTPTPLLSLEKVATPGTATIEALADFLNIGREQTAKIVFFTGTGKKEPARRLIICVIRGDLEVNPWKVTRLANIGNLRPATPEEIQTVGCVPGFASPIGIDRKNTLVVVDDSIMSSPNLVTGANQEGYHLLNSNYPRDYQADLSGDIALAGEGAHCPHCRSPLSSVPATRIAAVRSPLSGGHREQPPTYLDENGKSVPLLLGTAEFYPARLLATVAEAHHDQFGLCWPASIAPYSAILVRLKCSPEAQQISEAIYSELRDTALEVLFDDRQASPGVKFNDADLWGIPLRLTISDRSLEKGGVELKRRHSKEITLVPIENLVAAVKDQLAVLRKKC